MRLARGLGVLMLLALLGMSVAHAAPHLSSQTSDLPMTMTTPGGMLPLAAERAGPGTRAAYQIAISHPEVLAEVPCLCGCQASLGHRNNLDCYISSIDDRGSVTYSMHGLNCTVCQAITQLALDGAQRGLSGPELRRIVFDHYGVPS